ncbi:hypothetical protein ACGYV8_24540, partial [Burkholderia pseudomallei]
MTESCAPASEAARPADRAACAASERTDARRIEPETRATRKKKADPRARFFLVHRRKPWRLGERLRNLTPDFMDVRRRNCSIARHF